MQIEHLFEQYLKRQDIFADKSVLLASHLPQDVLYREEQLQDIANVLAPALRGEKPSNLFIYGKTGTGKTLSVRHVLNSLASIAAKNNVPLLPVYLNCKLRKVADTEYRLVAQLIKELGHEVPPTGLPTNEVYSLFYDLLDRRKQVLLLVLDEVDQLSKKMGDDLLYNLTRVNAELRQAQICIIGISNSLIFSEHLDPRVRSSLSEEELIFPPYNALQIQDILRRRAAVAFKGNVLQPGVVEKCAAYAALEHGDARRAIDLLRVAGEVAERNGSALVELEHLDRAERKIEADTILTAAADQPKQVQCVYYAILLLAPKKRSFFTGEIYDVYRELCRKYKCNVLTQRRVSDILAELDMLGFINAKIVFRGRYGRTRDISLSLDEAMILKLKELLEKSLLT